ncbi:MAG: ROK family protein [Bacteroidales bacterium]|nr:ROK family protein [Bacteroidales bacterium]
MKKIAIGVDVGGSHVSCAGCNLAGKKYLPETHSENELDNQGSAEEIISVWAKTIKETMLKTSVEKIAGIGFAMPGPFDYVNGVALFKGNNKKYENIYGLNVPLAIRKVLGLPSGFPVRFINDATAFAIGEDWIGKACGTSNSLSITLGTGFGSAFLSNRMPVTSGENVPETGAVWHLPFENGNADDYFSTRGLLNRYQTLTGKQLSGVKELAQLASNNEIANKIFIDFGFKMGVFLKPWLQKSKIEVLVIGGNISNAFSLFGKHLQDYLSENGVEVRVEISELKETAAMIGSSILADDTYYEQLKPLLATM